MFGYTVGIYYTARDLIATFVLRNVDEKDALDYVFGYTVGIDYTARDIIATNGGKY